MNVLFVNLCGGPVFGGKGALKETIQVQFLVWHVCTPEIGTLMA